VRNGDDERDAAHPHSRRAVKTVDHHVSAILAKLEVNKRRDAVRKARKLGILAYSAPVEVPL
jgi:hypothetical protein